MTHSPAPETRPEPVLDPAKLGGMVGAAVTGVGGVAALIAAGVTTDGLPMLGAAVSVAVTAVAALIVYLVAVFAGKTGRAAVTPLSSPRDEDGRRLVPDGDADNAWTRHQEWARSRPDPVGELPRNSITTPAWLDDTPGQHAEDRARS